MTASRAESQQSHIGRRRSNTAQSILRPPPPPPVLKFGDTQVLNSWVHDPKDSPAVMFNHSWWPGVVEGNLLRVMSTGSEKTTSSFLFIVPKDEPLQKPQLQVRPRYIIIHALSRLTRIVLKISIPKPIADVFSLRNNTEVILTKVDKTSCSADYVEFIFQDQYLGRNDMWRLGEQLVGQCIYTNQEVNFIGSVAAKILNIYIGDKKV